jgi:hypothetical protein
MTWGCELQEFEARSVALDPCRTQGDVAQAEQAIDRRTRVGGTRSRLEAE